MEIRVLEYFLAVAESGNISQAARVLHITQPTLSRQLAALEEELETELFIREEGKRRFRLTSEGLLLKRRAEELITLAKKTRAELKHDTEMIAGNISIGAGDVRALNTLAELCRDFRALHPRITFSFENGNADLTREHLDAGLLDLGLLLEPVDKGLYSFIRIPGEEVWGIFLPPDSPLAQKESVSIEDLKGVPLILPARLSVRSDVANWLGQAYHELNIFGTTNLPISSAALARAGAAAAFSVSAVISEATPGLIVRPLSPRLTSHCVIAWKRSKIQPPAVDHFLSFLHERLDEPQGSE